MKNKFKFSINKAGLASYTDMNSQELITKAVTDANTLEYISILTGVKYKTEMKYMDTDAVFQSGGCGFNASGTTTLTKKDMTVSSFKVNEALCPEDLNTTSLQLSMRPGFNTELPFEAAYAEYKAAKISEKIESYIWNGSQDSPETFDGLLDLFDADGTVVDVTFNPAGNHTAAEYVQLLFDMVNATPAAIKGKSLIMFMGYDYLAITAQKLIQANYYNAPSVALNDGRSEILLPGTNVKIVGVNGLNGTARIVVAEPSNLVFGTDLEGEQDTLKIFWDESNQEVRTVANFKIGVNYHFGDQVVVNQLA